MSASTPQAQNEAATFLVIETHNTWANFTRSYFFACIIGARTAMGARVRTAIVPPDINQAIGFAVSVWKPSAKPRADGSWHRRDGPAWQDTTVLLGLSTQLGFTNAITISNAFSYPTRVHIDLPVFRNFFAHRNQESEAAAQRLTLIYGIPSTLRPVQIVLHRPLGRPQPLLSDWIDDLDSVASL